MQTLELDKIDLLQVQYIHDILFRMKFTILRDTKYYCSIFLLVYDILVSWMLDFLYMACCYHIKTWACWTSKNLGSAFSNAQCERFLIVI